MVAKLTPIKPAVDPDPMATLYRTVRDAARCTDGVTAADRVATLELVKWELLEEMQRQIDRR